MNTVVSVKPEYGVNYKKGYVGFTFTDDSFISEGIAWFTRWDKGANKSLPSIDLSHVIIVSGDNECVEATTPEVTKTPLSHYFDNPHVHISFRKPKELNEEIAQRIIESASKKIGQKYDYFLIVGHLIVDTIIMRFIEKIAGMKIKNWIISFFNNRQSFVCSELVAYALNDQPEYKGKGVLKNPVETIDPQELFQDTTIFTDWSETIH